jgi:hypothetical protein
MSKLRRPWVRLALIEAVIVLSGTGLLLLLGFALDGAHSSLLPYSFN